MLRKGFTKGDPRAVEAGRKGGRTMRSRKSPDWYAGYQAGWKAQHRAAQARVQALPRYQLHISLSRQEPYAMPFDSDPHDRGAFMRADELSEALSSGSRQPDLKCER